MVSLKQVRYVDKKYLETIKSNVTKKEHRAILENAIAEFDMEAILSEKYPEW